MFNIFLKNSLTHKYFNNNKELKYLTKLISLIIPFD